MIGLAPVFITRPVGPSIRHYANSAVLAAAECGPEELLHRLKSLEHRFGTRRGQRWTARVLDCDIVLWDGGSWSSRGLTIPHPRFRERAFVLTPAVRIARGWRDPLTGLTLNHLHARLTRPRPRPSGTTHATPRGKRGP